MKNINDTLVSLSLDVKNFCFDDKKVAEVQKDLDAKKAKQENDIPINLIKENIELFSSVLSRMFNFYIDKISFPNSLKQADITPVHKKDEKK